MKPEEEIARAFLKQRFGADPDYEPLGKGTRPDYSIRNNAFEVRRLNEQHVGKDGKPEGLEQVEYPLMKAVYAELNKIPHSPEKGSFFWGLEYKRPLQVGPAKVARALAKRARAYYSTGSRVRQAIEAEGLTLRLGPASTSYGKSFILTFQFDDDSGGPVSEIYPNSIKLALEEKIAKTRDVAACFDRWVLVLVDAILPGFPLADEVGPMALDLAHFDSVVVIDITNGSLKLEWPTNSLSGVQV
jgi:hypothetical protein